jgi:DNA-binding FadR family transcriptional regulator
MAVEGLHSQVLAVIGPEIAAGDVPPGSVLRIEQLEERFDVSRTVAREVVRVLEAMQIVSLRRRVGVTIRPKHEWNLYDPLLIRWRLAGSDRVGQLRSLTELRASVEPVAAGLAARRILPRQCGDLTGLVVQLSTTAKARDLAAFLEHDIAFHRLVLIASGNEMFARLSDSVAEVLAGRTAHGLMPEEPDPRAVQLHAEVAEAIQSGDAPRAETAMRSIVQGAAAELSGLFASAPGWCMHA